MDQQMTERRCAPAAAGNLGQEVGVALALQREVGTVAAVEHLKVAGAGSALIARVLSEHKVRAGDGELALPATPEPAAWRALRHATPAA